MNPARIVEMASAFYESCVLFAASDLGLFECLGRAQPCTAEAVASDRGLDPRGARLLLDACAALKLVRKEADRYSNTPEAQTFLVPGSPAYLGGAIRYNRDVYPAWGRLTELARSGQPVERPEIHLGDDADRTRTFVMAMHGRAMGIGRAVVPQVQLADCRRLLDVGGGPGTYSVLLAQANPELSCTVLDLPEVVKVADELIRAGNMQERVRTMPGDYHSTPFPSDQDAVIFFGVLHQESPESIRALMTRAYEALAPGGRVYVLDMMTDPTHTRPVFSALFAVNMALTTRDGWVFADAELASWMEEAGFTEFQCVPLPSPMPHWLASAVKPGDTRG